MAIARKVLGQSTPVAATVTDLYTVPAATDAVISAIVICNTSATIATSFNISVAVAGAADAVGQRIVSGQNILPGETFVYQFGGTLATTDKIRVLAVLATVNFFAFGQEN